MYNSIDFFIILCYNGNIQIFGGEDMHKEDFDKLPACVNDFLHYIGAIKNKSKLTVLEYASDLSSFFKFYLRENNLCDNNTPFEEIDISNIGTDIIKNIRLQDGYAFLSFCYNERKK